MKKLISIVLALMFVSSCTLFKPHERRVCFANCQFRIVGVQAVEYNRIEDYDKLTVILKVAVQNPNEMEVMLERMRYTVFIDNESMVSTTTDLTAIIPAGGVTEFSLPTEMSVRELGQDRLAEIQAYEVAYQITGSASYTSNLGDFHHPITVGHTTWSH